MRASALLLAFATTTLAACSTTQPAGPVPAVDTMHVALHASAGKYSEMHVASMSNGYPLEVNVTITEPHSATHWLPSARLCVTGDEKTDFACLSLRLQRENGSIIAVAQSSFPSPLADQHFTPFEGQFGKPIRMVMKYDARGYTITLDGQAFPVAPVDFEITGYSFFCSSALCRFDFL